MQLMYDVKKMIEDGYTKLLKRCDSIDTANEFAHKYIIENPNINGEICIVPIICNDDFSDPIELTKNTKKL
ncbi:MAG: hypothetical protein J6W64_07930 [Bacilli bacterium]|nr:hypothetical protein [Bacilli bacterium]